MRTAIPIVLAAILVGGCAPHAAFQPERIPVQDNALAVKGWTDQDNFRVELRLDRKDKDVSLHSVSLLEPDGTKHRPAQWSDKTPKPPRIGVGLGVGIPIGGGGDSSSCHGGGSSSGSGLAVGPGISVPLTGSGDRKVTAIDAAWPIAERTTPVTSCTLEVTLICVRDDSISLTTVPLAMAFAQPDQQVQQAAAVPCTTATAASQPAEPGADQPDDTTTGKEKAKALVREINFTLKSPPTTRTLTT